MDTDSLLALLRSQVPSFYEVAVVVGKWVWIQFDAKQPAQVTRVLAELGFPWNDARQVCQHPCGLPPVAEATVDPRDKYRSYFPAVIKPA